MTQLKQCFQTEFGWAKPKLGEGDGTPLQMTNEPSNVMCVQRKSRPEWAGHGGLPDSRSPQCGYKSAAVFVLGKVP